MAGAGTGKASSWAWVMRASGKSDEKKKTRVVSKQIPDEPDIVFDVLQAAVQVDDVKTHIGSREFGHKVDFRILREEVSSRFTIRSRLDERVIDEIGVWKCLEDVEVTHTHSSSKVEDSKLFTT